jgi:hypothetical protein
MKKRRIFLYFLDKVPPEDCAALLKKLAFTMKYSPADDDTNGVKSRLATKMKSAETKENEDTEEQEQTARTPARKIPDRWLLTGFLISLVPCNDNNLSSINVILCKFDRGADAIARKKTRDKIIKALDPKLSANNISHIITATNASSFDIAANALAWQSYLQNICKFCVQYDMVSLLQIPTGVDFSKPERVPSATGFKDAINNWSSLEDETYFKWQEFIRHYGSPVHAPQGARAYP